MEVPANLPALVDHWVAEGIITHEQAERIRSEQARISPARAAAPAASRGRSGRPARDCRVSRSPLRAVSRWP
jgi:hypothetical protein